MRRLWSAAPTNRVLASVPHFTEYTPYEHSSVFQGVNYGGRKSALAGELGVEPHKSDKHAGSQTQTGDVDVEERKQPSAMPQQHIPSSLRLLYL